MSFALSGSIITQSGSDTTASTISGLLAIANVTSQVSQNYTRLFIPYKLNITGTMTNDSGVAFTFSRNGTFTNEVTISGNWTYKQARNENGFESYYTLPPMIFTQNQITGFNGTTKNAIYLDGGTIDFANVEIIANGGQYWKGGTLKLRDVTCNAQYLASNADTQFTTQGGNPTIDIIGWKVIGGRVFIKDANIVNFKGFEPTYMQRGFGSGFGLVKTLEDFSPKGNIIDASTYSGGVTTYKNASIGSDLKTGGWGPNRNSTNTILVTSTINITGKDENGDAVENFKLYYQDNPNGAPAGVNARTNVNYANAIVYNATSTADGVLEQDILLGVSVNDSTVVKRSVTQSDDNYSFLLVSYKNQIAQTPLLNLKGVGAKNLQQIMPLDTMLSNDDGTIVDSYTEIETPQKFYNKAKKYWYDNHAGETVLIVTRDANTITTTHNVVIDTNASEVFAFDGAIITLKANTFEGNITTTGTVTLLNGATINGGIIDANGDSFARFEGVDSWLVYANSEDASLNNNALGNGDSNSTYRFTFDASSTTFHIRTIVGARIDIFSITVTQGANIVRADIDASLAQIASTLNLTHDFAREAASNTQGA